MPTDVVMPQMGESIAEGTIVRWIKQVGDAVERDEPLFEISTDKVDAEIPAPVAGILAAIHAKAGETVPVNSVVAVIASSQAVAAAVPRDLPPAVEERPPVVPVGSAGGVTASPAPVAAPPAGTGPSASDRQATQVPPATSNVEPTVRQRSSPLVRRIAKEHHVDISGIQGSGIAGRVTKHDILAFLSASTPAAPPRAPGPSATLAPGGVAGTVVPMTVMRKKIAEHMVLSRRTSAHVHSVFEVSFWRVDQARQARKAEDESAGAKVTYLSFIIKAVVDALAAVPLVNASVVADTIVYHKAINVGVAVALDWGLIVPVIKNADEKTLVDLSRALADLAARARAKQLKPDEVAGGTFTITNPGGFGALFGMPIINQPQVAILGVGHIEKRPVVIDDAIAIRPMAYLSLGYDHRIIDGAVADEFMSHVKRTLENWDHAKD